MQFRLVYEGPLSARQKDPETGQYDKLAPHVHNIRKSIHEQLKELWAEDPHLTDDFRGFEEIPESSRDIFKEKWIENGRDINKIPNDIVISEYYSEYNYKFVPLVQRKLDLRCELNILMLRRDHGFGVIRAGDLDNRLKTLIDGLRKPNGANELRENEEPKEGESPFYTLLEDDDLVTGLTLQTDRLLVPLDSKSIKNGSEVYAVIDVKITPRTLNFGTANFY